MIKTNRTLIRPAQARQQYWAASIADAMRRKPGLIAFGEARDGPTTEESVTAFTTAPLASRPCTRSACRKPPGARSWPSVQTSRAGIGIELIELTRCFVAQILVFKIGGGRVAVPEHLVFDAAHLGPMEQRIFDWSDRRNDPEMMENLLDCLDEPDRICSGGASPEHRAPNPMASRTVKAKPPCPGLSNFIPIGQNCD